jgi:hypothetical protein
MTNYNHLRARIIMRLVPADARAVFRALGWLQSRFERTPNGVRLFSDEPYTDGERGICPVCVKQGVKPAKSYNITRAAHAVRHMIDDHGRSPAKIAKLLEKGHAPDVVAAIESSR